MTCLTTSSLSLNMIFEKAEPLKSHSVWLEIGESQSSVTAPQQHLRQEWPSFLPFTWRRPCSHQTASSWFQTSLNSSEVLPPLLPKLSNACVSYQKICLKSFHSPLGGLNQSPNFPAQKGARKANIIRAHCPWTRWKAGKRFLTSQRNKIIPRLWSVQRLTKKRNSEKSWLS